MRKEIFLILSVCNGREAFSKLKLNNDVNNKGRIMDDKIRMHEMQIQEA